MALNAQQQGTITRANRAQIAQFFARLPRNWRRNRWLPTNNRYARDTVNKIRADTVPGAHIRHSALASYIAASTAIHCLDGWSYLSRAIEAELSGDADAARHMGYYAELRAAMSILASDGIGVFNNKHFCVRAANHCERVAGKIGTHVFVWEALQFWSGQPSATDILLSVIKPGGRPLADWLENFPPTTGGAFRAVIAQFWLREWGLDLQRLADDQEARNESSYRPSFIAPRRRHSVKQSLRFIEDLWRAGEPSSINPFKVVDRYLLRNSLAFSFQHARGVAATDDPAEFARLAAPMFHAMLPTPGDYSDTQWRRHLDFSRPIKDLPLLVHANKTDDVTAPTHHLQVLSRAAILLRMATGITRQLVSTISTADLAHLSFWWEPIGASRGLWDSGSPPSPLTDLWHEVETSLNRLDTWRRSGAASKRRLFNGLGDVTHWLSSCERMALWGLGI